MDTAGQEKFSSLGAYYYRNASGALLVYDVTNKDSFDAVGTWLSELREGAGEDTIIMLIGNKSDLSDKR
jgi:small GTP-binding protein